MPYSRLRYLLLTSLVLAFGVILLGAYTRLTDAGLGCPDWPGCYGQLTAPQHPNEIQKANIAFPSAPVDTSKAQTEMTHRYFAESLGALIVIFSIIALWKRREYPLPYWLPLTLMSLVLFQGLLGMWTVTLQLWPIIVVLHLLGGFSTLGLLYMAILWLREDRSLSSYHFPATLKKLAMLMLAILSVQIFLGGWTSANYAALICPDFPTCQGQWWPTTHFAQAFNFFATIDTPARTAIHLAHRLGALLTLIVGGCLVHYMIHLRKTVNIVAIQSFLRRYARLFTGLLILQIALGISNVIFFLPRSVAVMHNGVAALLFLTLIALNFNLYSRQRGVCV